MIEGGGSHKVGTRVLRVPQKLKPSHKRAP